jgi:membrane fusion protein
MDLAKPASSIPQDAMARPGKDIFPIHLPSWVAMSIGFLVILMFGVALIGAFVVPVPDTIRCPFVLVPMEGADPVRAPLEGQLTRILVTEAQEVRKGQELFVLRSKEIQSWTTELHTLEYDGQTAKKRAVMLAEVHQSEVEIQRTRIQQHEKDLLYQREYLGVLKDFLSRMEKLDAEGLVSRVDLLSQRLATSKAERDVALTQQAREMAVLDLQKMQTEHRKQVAEQDLEMERITVRLASLRRLLQDCQEDAIRIRAPFDGTVVAVEKKNVGDVVSYGQELTRLARADATLVGELSPPEDGVPRLQQGQKVQLFFTAFPYERFGSGLGTLQWVSPAAVATPNGEQFVVRVALDTPTMNVQGQARPLRPGMHGEARILVGRRTVIEYVFEPIRKLRETWPKSK